MKSKFSLIFNLLICENQYNLWTIFLFSFFFLLSSLSAQENKKETPVYTYRVVKTYPHDAGAFTQGLVFQEGILYEGTGQHGYSTLRKVDLQSGATLKFQKLPDYYFGEGITIWEENIIQLTWRSHIAIVYDKTSLMTLEEFSYPMEGWGITHDGKNLIVSDGTRKIYFLDPITYEEIKTIEVEEVKEPILRLNELEYINGEIFANIWPTNIIARINPENGKINSFIDLNELLRNSYTDGDAVLNGIAYDHGKNRLFVTGKLWPSIFEIELILKD